MGGKRYCQRVNNLTHHRLPSFTPLHLLPQFRAIENTIGDRESRAPNHTRIVAVEDATLFASEKTPRAGPWTGPQIGLAPVISAQRKSGSLRLRVCRGIGDGKT